MVSAVRFHDLGRVTAGERAVAGKGRDGDVAEAKNSVIILTIFFRIMRLKKLSGRGEGADRYSSPSLFIFSMRVVLFMLRIWAALLLTPLVSLRA